MKIGYARVSTLGQSLEIQIEELTRHGVERICSEKKSGTKIEGREELQALLRFMREGDELYVTRLDRLARSVGDLIGIAQTLQERGVSLHVIQQAIETKTPAGRLFFAILGAIGQFETELRGERQREGIAAAKRAGTYKAKPRGPSYDRAEIARMRFDHGMSVSAIARSMGCAEFTIRRALKEIRPEGGVQ